MKKHKNTKPINSDLASFDKELCAMAKDGEFDESIDESLERLMRRTEPSNLSNSELSRFYQTVGKASLENAIMEARGNTPLTNLPIGRFIQLIRDRSKLSYAQVAKALNKDASFVERLENGRIDPLKLMAHEVADIMQLFRLNISELTTTLKAFISAGTANQKRVSGMARSSMKAGASDKGERLAHAMDALQMAIANKKGERTTESVHIDTAFIEGVRRELQKRDAKDLLV